MKRRLKKFCHRGSIFSGFGPIIYALVMLILYLCGVDTLCDGLTVFKGIFSTYLLGFIVSGISIIWEEEKLGIGFAVIIHGTTLYLCYLGMYLINGWIPNGSSSIGIFSVVFIATYVLIWLIILMVEKNRAKSFNVKLSK